MATAEQIAAGKLLGMPQLRSLTSLTAGSPLLWIRYLGTTDSGATLAVADATGDLTATTDGSTADTTFLESGGTNGTIDVSDVNANTFGEVLDIINGSPNWEAYLLGDIRAGVSTDMLTTLAAVDLSTSAKKSTGQFLYGDSGVSFDASFAISAFEPRSAARESGESYFSDENCIAVLNYISATSTYGSGTSTIQVYSASQTGETLIYDVAGGATTAEGEVGATDPVDPFVTSKKGERLVVKLNNSAAMTAISLVVNGYSFPIGGQRLVIGYTL